MRSVQETAKILGIGEQTLQDWVNQGRISSVLENDTLFFTEENINDFISKYKIKLISPEQLTDKGRKFNSDAGLDLDEYYKENYILAPDEIAKLIDKMNK